MNIEFEYQKALLGIDSMIADHSPLELCEDSLFDELKRLVEEADNYDAQLHPIENETTITIELETIEYVQLVIKARKAGQSINTYITEALKTLIENYEHETGNRLPQGPSEG